MTSTYIPPRDRDACATIRGFVYQVDLTLVRWLDLEDGQELELERGEDIDLVSRALGATNQDEERRLLEQVKHREDNLTLRKPAALEALANAVEHFNDNREIDLRISYSTNAGIGQERPSLFVRRVPAISVWESIRRGQLTGTELSEALKALRRFLTSASQPDGFDDDVWANFQSYVGGTDDHELASFVRRFEWSTGQSEASSHQGRIKAILQERGLATNEPEADELYERLFLHIFKLLCEPGIKRLTPEALRKQIARPTLSSSDRDLLGCLRDRLRIIEVRVGEVEIAVAALTTSVRTLAERQVITGALTTTTPIPDLGLPPLVPRLTGREGAVRHLVEEVNCHPWTALHGGPDTGKSQLASLVARQLGTCRGWIRFHHDMNPERAGVILDQALRAVTGLRQSREREGWYQNVCARLGAGDIIVVDDMPRLPGNDSLSQRLIELVPAISAANVRLLSTSLHTLPAAVRTALGPTAIHEIITPALTEVEAEELFRSFGAPQVFLTAGRVRFVNGLASGHPLLLSLAAEYLERNNWRLDDARLDGFLRGEHAGRLAEDVVTQLIQTLDQTRRDLLYRLTLPIGTFTADEVSALAAVVPAVSRPRECLNDLLGAWVQWDTEERLSVSPLVRVVGAGDLPPQTKVDCHLVLAERIVAGRMSPFDAEIAIGHFMQAREVGRAGTLFLILLQKVADAPASADVRSTVAIWADLPLPGEMDVGLRLLIRSLQIKVLPRFGRRIDFILNDIDRVLEETTGEHGWAIAALAMYAVTSLAETDPDRALGYLHRALSLPEEILGPTGDSLSLPAGFHFDELLWPMIKHINKDERLRNWLATAESLPDPRLERLFQSSLARLGSLVLGDRLSVEQLRKPPSERDWESVLHTLEELANWAITKRLPLLLAAAVRSKVYALGEQGRIDEALVVGEVALGRTAGDPVAHFLIAGAMGRFLVRARRFPEARSKLNNALAQPVNDYPHERMLFFLAASHCYGVEDREAGVRYAREAIAICRSEEEIPRLEVARAYAELAVAQFLESDVSAAFAAWSDAAEKLFAAREESDQWKDSFVIFAHMTGYMSALAATGHPPAHTRDGEEFAAPERGLFLQTHPDRPAYYLPGSEPGIMWALAQYAWAVGDQEGSARWLTRASEAVSSTRMSYLQATIARDLIPSLILSDRYGDAIDAGLRSCQALQVFRSRPFEEQDPFGEGLDLDAAVAALSSEQQALVETSALVIAVIPAFMRIGALATDDRVCAYSAARSLAAVCRQVGENAQNSRLWAGVGEILERGSSDVRRARDLYDFSLTFEGDSFMPLRVLGYLASSMHGTVDEAFAAQLATTETLFAWYPPGSQMYERLLLPYLEKFWTSRFREARFQFRSPNLVEVELVQAVSRPPQERLRAILRAVRLGVNIRGLEEALRWLSQN